jgi:hypothetical protein
MRTDLKRLERTRTLAIEAIMPRRIRSETRNVFRFGTGTGSYYNKRDYRSQ